MIQNGSLPPIKKGITVSKLNFDEDEYFVKLRCFSLRGLKSGTGEVSKAVIRFNTRELVEGKNGEDEEVVAKDSGDNPNLTSVLRYWTSLTF